MLKKAFIILAVCLLFASLSCKKPELIIIPVEMDIVQQLENGNYEVKSGLLYKYFKSLAEINKLKIELAECRNK